MNNSIAESNIVLFSLLALVVSFSITNFAFSAEPQLVVEDSQLSKIIELLENSTSIFFQRMLITMILAAISIIATIALYWYKDKKDQKQVIERSKRSIKKEIEENKIGLQNEAFLVSYVKKYKTKDDFHVNFSNYYFDTTAFDSIVHSGYFVRIDEKMQHDFTSLYHRIKKHNDVIDRLDEYEDVFFLNEKNESRKQQWSKAVMKYHKYLTELDLEIKNLVREIERKSLD